MLIDFLNQIKEFATARAYMAALELGLLPALQDESLTRAELVQRLELASTPITESFFDVLLASGLLEESGGKLALSATAQAVLPAYESVHSWNEEMAMFYRSLDDMAALLKTGQYQGTTLSHYWAYKATSQRGAIDAAAVAGYSSVMEESQEQLSQIIASAYDFSACQHVIDFGGGYARLAITLARAYPHLHVTVADLPAVCEGAQARIEAAGLSARIDCLPVDFLQGALPAQVADTILFVRVLHDWGDAEIKTLLARTRGCLKPGGTAAVIEPMPDEDAGRDKGSAASGLMVALMGGRRRSLQTIMGALEEAGYTHPSWHELGLSLYKVVTAETA